jgi:hypothetical protein
MKSFMFYVSSDAHEHASEREEITCGCAARRVNVLRENINIKTQHNQIIMCHLNFSSFSILKMCTQRRVRNERVH